MIMPAVLVTSLGLMIPVADTVPRYDVRPTCRAAVALAGGGPEGRTVNSCVAGEEAARKDLEKQWAKVPTGERTQCIGIAELCGASHLLGNDARFADASPRRTDQGKAVINKQESLGAKHRRPKVKPNHPPGPPMTLGNSSAPFHPPTSKRPNLFPCFVVIPTNASTLGMCEIGGWVDAPVQRWRSRDLHFGHVSSTRRSGRLQGPRSDARSRRRSDVQDQKSARRV
jgi:hypothetical protein